MLAVASLLTICAANVLQLKADFGNVNSSDRIETRAQRTHDLLSNLVRAKKDLLKYFLPSIIISYSSSGNNAHEKPLKYLAASLLQNKMKGCDEMLILCTSSFYKVIFHISYYQYEIILKCTIFGHIESRLNDRGIKMIFYRTRWMPTFKLPV
jgi:hypothetical protein